MVEAVGTIGVIHRGIVSADFAQSLACLHTPGPVKTHFVEGSHIAWQRNQVIRQMEGSWVFFLDTDQVCAPDTLLRLLAVHQPIVSGLIAQRHAPFRPVAFCGERQLTWAEIPAEGLLEVDHVGTGCLLIHRAVINCIPIPWFAVGQIDPERVGEDLYFSRKAREAGLSLRIDCDVRVGHQTTVTVWPRPGEGVELELPGESPVGIAVPEGYGETY